MKGKKQGKKENTPIRINTFKTLSNDIPVSIDMTFEDAVKKALNTPLKNSKIHKK